MVCDRLYKTLYRVCVIDSHHLHACTYNYAGDALKSVEPLKAGKWKKYLDLKAAFYQSYVSEVILLDHTTDIFTQCKKMAGMAYILPVHNFD